MNRRAFLRASAMVVAAAGVGACAPGAPAPTPTEAAVEVATQAPEASPSPAAPLAKYSEAPMLAELVSGGTLEPVEQRLPPTPQIIEPIEEVGQYGGTVRVAIGNANALFGDGQAVIGTELVLRIDRDFNSITGGLFESWEFNDDATEQVLYLRKGLRWSDGQPMTTQDCLFDWEDCRLNEELFPAGPGDVWRAGPDKVPMKMTALDDYTLKLEFAASYPLIILNQGFYSGCQGGGMWAPKHYGQQFHPKYADQEDLDKLVKDAGFENWTQLFGDKMRVGSTIPAAVGLPGMTAFIRTADDPDHHTYERNPYYWKVDTAGNQLPYFDKVIVYIVPDKELLTAKLLAGDLDFVGHSTYLKNMELYKRAEQEGKVKVYLWKSTLVSAVIIYPNLTAKDPELRDFFQRLNVRRALSISINRDEINDVVHFGLGEPRQVALWPNSIYYKEGDEAHYAEYDPDRANQLLDEEGFTQRDSEGYRLFPSGKRIGWLGEFDPEQGDIQPTLELCIQYWKDIGIEFSIKPVNRQLLSERAIANELPMLFWQGDVGSDIVFPSTSKILHAAPEWGNALGWGRAWEAYMTLKGQFPDLEEEPPDWVKAQYTDRSEFNVTLDEQERIAIMRRMLDRFYEHLPCFGTVGVPQAIVTKPNFGNFPEDGVWGFATIRAVPVNPEQFFYK
ncbi:MAG: ABC transporter substrate-binding protein [Anaerolineae bacterium]|nr:ABC transporter substrate-binding protein [Anaerolineae bacterium]